jgi:hypothetical protein
MQVMPSARASFPVDIRPRRWKCILPPPIPLGRRDFSGKRIGQYRATHSAPEVTVERLLPSLQMNSQGRHRESRQRHPPIVITLARANEYLGAIKVEILHPEQ